MNRLVSREGFYVCFCRNQIETLEKDPFKEKYELEYQESNGKTSSYNEPICKRYAE